MFKYTILSLFFVFAIGNYQVAWSQLNIDDLIEQAVQNSFQLKGNNYQILRAQSLNTTGVAGNLPRVSISGNARTDINNIRLQFFDNREISRNNADNYSAGTNLDVEYPLFE
ncbi:MAG: TolC family protein, partial [Bacteroidetes bacterium]|nr:TolC family protein [Bacteroidota bacterium]